MPAPTESPSLLQRVPKKLLIGGGVIVVLLLIGWFAGRGKTNADDLQAGDCFEAPTGTDDIRDVKDQSCDGLHEVEILVVTSLPAGAAWPGLDPFALSDTPATDACFDAIDPTLLNLDNVPDDTLEGHFYPAQDAWDDGDRKLLCYAQSATGFPGPVMNRE
ncbi:MAG: septum formation family protein [Acidimicrobiales bacterium]